MSCSAIREASDEVARLMCGFSPFVYVPDGLPHDNSAGTGTVLRPSTLRDSATEARFSGVDVLPIGNDRWRFLRVAA